jgi:putative ABC transport system permease protein
MLPFLLQLSAGHVRRHRLEAVLCLIGVALGVAVVIAIEAAVAACVQSFTGAVDSLAERSTHSIFAETGPVADADYIALLKKRLPFPLAPVIDRRVLVVDSSGREHLARLIGIDVFSERSLRSFTKMQSSLDGAAFEKFMTEQGAVVPVRRLADDAGLNVGKPAQLVVGGERKPVQIVGVITPAGVAAAQLTDVLICDLATAQELTGSLNSIDRIDTVLDGDAAVAAMTAALPPGLVLRSTSQQAGSFAQLIQSYKLNLNALSLMASFVAVFVVYNSMLISVRQRLATLGILRCLGASRRQLGGLYLTEALVYAGLGGVIGVWAGWGLAHVLVGYVGTTINDLYAAVRPVPVTLDKWLWVEGMAVAIVSCLLGAVVPLVQASRTPPINAFRGGDRVRSSARTSLILLAIGVLLLAAAWGAYVLPGESPVAGFAMALLVSSGFAVACPWVLRAGCQIVERIARPMQQLPVQMASAGVGRMLGITGVAVAATMMAMAMNIGIRTMVLSFRSSLDSWMDRRFAADIFVAPELLVNHKTDATLDPAVTAWVTARPEVASATPVRSIEVPIGTKPAQLVATDVRRVLRTLPIKSSSPGPFDPAADVLISEPLAGRLHQGAGSVIELPTPTGRRRFNVRAVYYDFGTERGQIMIDGPVYAADWNDPAVNSLAVTVKPGVDRRAAAAEWSRLLRSQYPVSIDSFDAVKIEAMTVFDRTFKVTVVLTWLSGGVAFCGLAGSLLALSMARRRDYSLLTAVGMSGRQTTVWVASQGLIIAVVSAVVAPVAGTLLAFVLAYVIQYRSFGWSIPAKIAPVYWVENLALAVVAAAVAAIYPAWRVRRDPPAVELKAE